MAIQMKSDQLVKLLTEMFGVASKELNQSAALVASGHTVNSGLFNFYVQIGEQRFEYTSPAMLAKFASQTPMVQDMIRAKVSEVLHKATEFVGGDTGSAPGVAEATPATPQPSPTVDDPHLGADPEPAKAECMNASPAETELQATATAAAQAELAKPPNAEPALVNAVIKLSEARVVNQKVKGSSGSAIYHAAAIGSVNVAIRVKLGTISVRAEFQKERDDSMASKLVKMGFTDHTGYLSMHIQLDGTPPARVLGSILYGMEVEFDQISTVIGALNA